MVYFRNQPREILEFPDTNGHSPLERAIQVSILNIDPLIFITHTHAVYISVSESVYGLMLFMFEIESCIVCVCVSMQ